MGITLSQMDIKLQLKKKKMLSSVRGICDLHCPHGVITANI